MRRVLFLGAHFPCVRVASEREEFDSPSWSRQTLGITTKPARRLSRERRGGEPLPPSVRPRERRSRVGLAVGKARTGNLREGEVWCACEAHARRESREAGGSPAPPAATTFLISGSKHRASCCLRSSLILQLALHFVSHFSQGFIGYVSFPLL